MDFSGLCNKDGIKVQKNKEDRAGAFLSGYMRIMFMSNHEVHTEDRIARIAAETIYSYQDVWLMSQFVREDALEDALECAALFGDSVAEYLISVGAAPAGVIHAMIHRMGK